MKHLDLSYNLLTAASFEPALFSHKLEGETWCAPFWGRAPECVGVSPNGYLRVHTGLALAGNNLAQKEFLALPGVQPFLERRAAVKNKGQGGCW